ncbi:MAG: TIGR00730 family Rossman fold protein, partial [Verrucomicrobiales bacterium]|nr:TIGR00730 family Rossman fold protein [Verrucomicrobiales bacterium]
MSTVKNPIHTLCVFCGSQSGTDPVFGESTREIGRFLAEKQIRIVYGGGSIGLMGTLADAALEAGGEVIG